MRDLRISSGYLGDINPYIEARMAKTLIGMIVYLEARSFRLNVKESIKKNPDGSWNTWLNIACAKISTLIL